MVPALKYYPTQLGDVDQAENAAKATYATASAVVAMTTTTVATAAGEVTALEAAIGALSTTGAVSVNVPVVGWVAAAVAFAAATTLKIIAGKKAAKLIDEKTAAANQQLIDLQNQVYAIDQRIADLQNQYQQALTKLSQAGLGSLTSWLADTFTPKKAAEKRLSNATNLYNYAKPQLEQHLAEADVYVHALTEELQKTLDKLLLGTFAKDVLIWGSLGLAALLLMIDFNYKEN